MSRPRGVVPLVGRGGLAAQALHGRPLWRHAIDSLARVVDDPVLLVEPHEQRELATVCRRDGLAVRVLSSDEWPDVVRRAGDVSNGTLLVHDPLCPLVPHQVLADFWRLGEARPHTSYAAFRPVTDTVKTAVGGRIVGTIDRDRLAALTSPVLVAAPAVPGVSSDLLGDPHALLSHVRDCGPTELRVTPPIARRVDDVSAVHLLECVDELERRVRHAAGAGTNDARDSRTP